MNSEKQSRLAAAKKGRKRSDSGRKNPPSRKEAGNKRIAQDGSARVGILGSSPVIVLTIVIAAGIFAVAWITPARNAALLIALSSLVFVIVVSVVGHSRLRKRFAILNRLSDARDARLRKKINKMRHSVDALNSARDKLQAETAAAKKALLEARKEVAAAYEKAEDWIGAADAWQKASDFFPGGKGLRLQLAAAYERTEKWDAAIRERTAFAEQTPDHRGNRLKLAADLEQLENWSAAIAEREKILELFPGDHHNRLLLARVLYETGQRDRAYGCLIESNVGGPAAPPLVLWGLQKAIETGDTEWLPAFIDAFKAMLARPDFPRPEIPNLLFWHALVRLGEFDTALDYLQAPPRNLPAATTIGARPSAHVVDPAFIPSAGAGHHYNLNLLFQRMFSKIDLPTTFYGRSGESANPTDFDFRPATTLPMYARHPLFNDLQWLRQVNLYFEAELTNHVPNNGYFVFHTMTCTTILGMARWSLNNLRDKRTPMVIGVVDADLATKTPLHDAAREVYREALELLRQLGHENLLIFGETDGLIEKLNELGGEGFGIRKFPYVGASLALDYSDKDREDDVDGNRLTFGYIGATRGDRGSAYVPQLVIDSRASLGAEIEWVAQLDLDRLRTIAGPVIGEAIEQMQADRGVDLVDAGMSTADYFALLRRIDIVVLPYDQRYRATGSGVFIEALTLGKVMILPEDGWMADFARQLGSVPVTFKEARPDQLLQATRDAARRYPELKAGAQRAADLWNTKSSGVAEIESWLRLRLHE